MMLECKRFLRPRGVHPIGEEPAVVIVRVTRPALGQHAGQAEGGRQCGADVLLQELVRVVARDQQDLADDVGRCGGGERGADVAHVDRVNPPVGGQCALDVYAVGGQRQGAEVRAEHAAEPKHDPIQAARRGRTPRPETWCCCTARRASAEYPRESRRSPDGDCASRRRRCSTPVRSEADSVAPRRRAPTPSWRPH